MTRALLLSLLALLGLRSALEWGLPQVWVVWEEPTPEESTPLPAPPPQEGEATPPQATQRPPCLVVCPPTGWGCYHECGDGDG